MKESSPWLQVTHSFNHRLELSIKDGFKTDTFVKIDKMLMKLYYLYQKPPKRLRELKRMSEHGRNQFQICLKVMVLVGLTTS